MARRALQVSFAQFDDAQIGCEGRLKLAALRLSRPLEAPVEDILGALDVGQDQPRQSQIQMSGQRGSGIHRLLEMMRRGGEPTRTQMPLAQLECPLGGPVGFLRVNPSQAPRGSLLNEIPAGSLRRKDRKNGQGSTPVPSEIEESPRKHGGKQQRKDGVLKECEDFDDGESNTEN